jgi:hypothetical protein
MKIRNKKGVFGLTSVQQFFAIILGVVLLAYVVVVIMGTLNESTILTDNGLTQTVTNESANGGLLASVNETGYQLTNSSANGIRSPAVLFVLNGSSGVVIPAANYSFNAATSTITNGTATVYNRANITWSYIYNSEAEDDVENILLNTSEGVTSFFSNINPVYAILAILVIILVLIVLVRVVTGGTGGGIGRRTEPQL